MGSRSRKIGQKDWALDHGDDVRVGFREKYGANNKLWGALVILVVVTALAGILVSSRHPKEKLHVHLASGYAGSISDEAHRAFLSDFVHTSKNHGVSVQVEFLTASTLRIVMPYDVDSDDIRFLSHIAAMRLHSQLRINPLVLTYLESNQGSGPVMVAQTKWDPAANDFVVKESKR